MIRRAFTMRLKPGALGEYARHHDSVPTRWAALARQIEASGIARMVIFAAGGEAPQLFLYSEIVDEQAWTRLWDSPIHREWAALMEPLMQFNGERVDAADLREVFCLETGAGRIHPAPHVLPSQQGRP